VSLVSQTSVELGQLADELITGAADPGCVQSVCRWREFLYQV